MKQVDYIRRWYSDPARKLGQLVRPRQLNFPVTDTCNARCVMCNVWRENATDDMSLEDLASVLKDPFFQDLEHVGISGGEPFLRKDLVEIVKLFTALPKLKSLSITSHGFNHARHQAMAAKIVDLARQRGVPLTMNLSFDGVNAVHDQVRGVPGGFRKLERTFALYRSLGVRVVGQCTVSKANLYNLPELEQFSRDNNLEMIYRLSTSIERLYNHDVIDEVKLDKGEQSFFADFLLYSGVIERTSNPARRLFYRQLVDTLQSGSRRKAPCYYQNEAVLLNANGDVFQCSIVKDAVCNARRTPIGDKYFSPENRAAIAEVKREICTRCPHDQSGAWPPQALIKEQLRNTRIGQKAQKIPEIASKAWTTSLGYVLPPSKPTPLHSGKSTNAVIVGCYGGEHVGDAAILGGVLLRLHREYGVERAVVLSTRIDRTEVWANQLQTPVSVTVKSYDKDGISATVPQSDLLVIGGGPIMDLPALLAQHLRAARAAHGAGVPVIAEGVGYGPFRRAVSQTLARKLLGMTAKTTFRTKKSFEAASEFAANPVRTFDPAFTYLEQVNSARPSPPQYIAGIRKPDRKLVAINLRPLWTRYATGNFDENQVQAIGERCIAAVAAMINGNPQYDFVFLPFNSDQLGQSDLNVAYSLRARAGTHANFYIWESEPSIHELIGALGACDAMIAMRFHACIFGLSMNLPVIGLDYGIGKPSKVAELLTESGFPENALSVESVTADALKNRLHSIVHSTRARLAREALC